MNRYGQEYQHRGPAQIASDSGDIMAVFGALDTAGIWYAVWKDVPAIDTFAAGDAELDVLVKPDDLTDFAKCVRQFGFVQYRNWLDVYRGQLSHFIRFHAGKHYHLHVHVALLTGEHYAKEYCLDALFEAGLPKRVPRAEVQVVAESDELLIGLVRLAAKSSRPRQVATTELYRLREIYTPNRFDDGIERLRRATRVSEITRDLLREAVATATWNPRALHRYECEFRQLRRYGRLRARAMHYLVRLANAWHHSRGLSNKKLSGAAESFAVVGVDGSGKSSLVARLHAMLSVKVSSRTVYLGGNRKTYSLKTLGVLVFNTGFAVLQRWFSNVQCIRDLYWVTRAWFESAKCEDRINRIRLGRRLSAKGVIVIFERYPMVGLFDYPAFEHDVPGYEQRLSPWARRQVRQNLASIDEALHTEGPPKLTILVKTSLATIESRRALVADERLDIENKLARLAGFDSEITDHKIAIMNNEGDLTNLLSELSGRLNRELCSSNL